MPYRDSKLTRLQDSGLAVTGTPPTPGEGRSRGAQGPAGVRVGAEGPADKGPAGPVGCRPGDAHRPLWWDPVIACTVERYPNEVVEAEGDAEAASQPSSPSPAAYWPPSQVSTVGRETQARWCGAPAPGSAQVLRAPPARSRICSEVMPPVRLCARPSFHTPHSPARPS